MNAPARLARAVAVGLMLCIVAPAETQGETVIPRELPDWRSLPVPLPRPRPAPPAARTRPAPVPLAPAAARPAHRLGSVIVRSSWQEHRHYIRFDWPRPVAAAVFRRGPWIWVVFDGALPVNFVEQKKAELIQPVAHPTATVFRIVAPTGFNPTIARVGSAWVVDLQDQALRPEHPITPEPHPEAAPPRVHFGLHFSAAAPVEVVDPDLGERLLVIPNGELGEGLERNASFVDFQALASAQGLALQPTGQALSVTSSASGVEVMGHLGLHLARSSSRTPPPAQANPGRLLDLASWGAAPGKHVEKRQALTSAAASAPEPRRTQARLDLARFYFAEGLAPEAYGVLKAIERDDPGLFTQPAPRLLEGAAAFLDGDLDGATNALSGKALDHENEASIWRAALAAARGNWTDAAAAFDHAGPILATYPAKIRHALVLTAARAAVDAQQHDAARRLLEPLLAEKPSLADRGAALLLVAELHRQQGDIAKAVAIWNELAEGPDKLSRVKARLERTLALLDRKGIQRSAAIEQLEAVRAEWRGDEIEFRTLRALAALKLQDGDWRGGFEAFHQIRTNFPDDKEGKAVEQQAADAMAALFVSPAFAGVPPVPAFKLFEEYGPLIPVGERRDAMATRLADRLGEVDLPERAASVVEAQLEGRPIDAETARLTSRLAAFRLGEHKPELALAALDRTVGEVAPEVAAGRRALKARALAELGKTDEALAALGEDVAPAADRVRLEILTRAKRWKETLPVYARLAPPRDGKLADAAARQVLNWATAATLAGDAASVATIRESFAPAMETTPDRDAFRLVTGDPRALRDEQKVSSAR
jgi:tetratricopeptide (TPR) repeat protein